jgi:cytochrome c biogenesis protein CcmG, thiol:disulfide interchange protein DsbE
VTSRNRTAVIVGTLVAVVLVAAVVIALVAGGGGGGDDTADTVASGTGPGGLFPGVTITGDSLPPFTQEVAQSGDDPAVGTKVPVLSGFDYEGNATTIDPAHDGPTMAVFLAHWCPHCNREVPLLVDWERSGDVPDGLNVVGVSTDVRSDAPNYPPDQWLRDEEWPWPVLADDENSAALASYGGTSFPTLVFVDGDGTVVRRISGEYPIEEIQQYADELMAS